MWTNFEPCTYLWISGTKMKSCSAIRQNKWRMCPRIDKLLNAAACRDYTWQENDEFLIIRLRASCWVAPHPLGKFLIGSPASQALKFGTNLMRDPGDVGSPPGTPGKGMASGSSDVNPRSSSIKNMIMPYVSVHRIYR
jgi:hypothetical protein